MENTIEIIEHINRDGVVTKKTANGFELPLPYGDKPSYVVWEPVGDDMMKKTWLTPKEFENIYSGISIEGK